MKPKAGDDVWCIERDPRRRDIARFRIEKIGRVWVQYQPHPSYRFKLAAMSNSTGDFFFTEEDAVNELLLRRWREEFLRQVSVACRQATVDDVRAAAAIFGIELSKRGSQ